MASQRCHLIFYVRKYTWLQEIAVALRKWHLFMGFLTFILYIVLYWYIGENEVLKTARWHGLNPIWVIGAFWMAMIGAEFPDWDQMTSIGGIRLFRHRDWTTHSILLPFLLTVPFVVTRLDDPDDPNLIFGVLFAAFFFGMASHLFLDLWPTMNVDHMLKRKGLVGTNVSITKGFFEGLAGWGQKFTGTYLIHLPFRMPVIELTNKKKEGIALRKTLPKHLTRLWLVVNGLLCLLLGIILINFIVEFEVLEFLLFRN